MGRLKTISTLLLVLLFLSGCGNILAEPDRLITPPTMNTEQFKERKVITSLLGEDEHITVPRDMDEPAPSVDIDVDEDGRAEKLVFWVKNNGYQTGITLLKQNNDNIWSVLDQKKYSGRSIAYFKSEDLDGDGTKELLVGVDIGGYNTLFIYRPTPDGLVEIDKINYSFMTLAPLAKGGPLHLITSLSTTVAGISTTDVNVYRSQSVRMKRLFHQSFDGYCQEMNFGRVYKDKTGLYLALSSDFNSTTMVLLPFDGTTFKERLRRESIYLNALAERREGVIQDINKDGVLDILTVRPPMDASKSESGEFLQIWSTWNGQNDLLPIYSIIENKRDGYKFRVPTDWLDALSYQYVIDDQQSALHFYDGRSKQQAPVFSIISEEVDRDTDLKTLGKTHTVLGTSPANRRVYLAEIHKDTFADKPLDVDMLRRGLKIEGGS